MAQPTILATTFAALKTRMRRLQNIVSQLQRGVNLAESTEKSMVRQGFKVTEIEAVLTDLMDSFLTELGDELKTAIDIMPWDYNRELRMGFAEQDATNELIPGSLSMDIDVNNGSSKAELTVNSNVSNTGFFDAFDVGDKIAIENCEDPDNNGNYVVDARTSTVLTLTTVMGGTDNTDDETIRVRIYQRA